MSKTPNTDVNTAIIGHLEIDMETMSGCVPTGVLRISSDRDDQRSFGGLKFSISEFLGGRKILASIFLGIA